MTVLLGAICGVLVAAALWELWGGIGETATAEMRRRAGRLPGLLPDSPAARAAAGGPLADRLRRAGLEGRVDPRLLQLSRMLCVAAAIPVSLSAAPVAPGRGGLLVAVGVPLSAALLPDLVLERIIRRRSLRIAAALPDSLEVMAVGAGAGSGSRALLAAAASGCRPGPLRDELLRAAAEVECGRGSSATLGALAARTGGDVAALAQLLDRSRRLGSPLASGLQEQSVALRDRHSREIEEQAARAAPKIQLVVALLLVPSVLLLVAAAVLANADSLLAGL